MLVGRLVRQITMNLIVVISLVKSQKFNSRNHAIIKPNFPLVPLKLLHPTIPSEGPNGLAVRRSLLGSRFGKQKIEKRINPIPVLLALLRILLLPLRILLAPLIVLLRLIRNLLRLLLLPLIILLRPDLVLIFFLQVLNIARLIVMLILRIILRALLRLRPRHEKDKEETVRVITMVNYDTTTRPRVAFVEKKVKKKKEKVDKSQQQHRMDSQSFISSRADTLKFARMVAEELNNIDWNREIHWPSQSPNWTNFKLPATMPNTQQHCFAHPQMSRLSG